MTLAALSARTLPFGEVDDEFDDPAMSDLAVEKGRILIVDDNAQAATLMRRLIEREGFSHVMAVGDGRRALDVVLEHPPDVVVLDVHLPHIDGYALLREIIRSDERTGRPTGVLAISGDALSETGKSMLSAGADDFIPRPFESGEFRLRVRRLAGRTRTLRRALAYSQFLERRVADLSDQ